MLTNVESSEPAGSSSSPKTLSKVITVRFHAHRKFTKAPFTYPLTNNSTNRSRKTLTPFLEPTIKSNRQPASGPIQRSFSATINKFTFTLPNLASVERIKVQKISKLPENALYSHRSVVWHGEVFPSPPPGKPTRSRSEPVNSY